MLLSIKGCRNKYVHLQIQDILLEYKFASTPFIIECKNRGEGVNKYKIKVVDKYVMYQEIGWSSYGDDTND